MVIFHTEEGLYTWNICINRQFWHFLIIISWNINLIFYYQVSRITNDFSVHLFDMEFDMNNSIIMATLPFNRALCWSV